MKKKKSKWDLIWIIPEIIGSIAILVSAIHYLFKLSPPSLDILFFVFNISLIMVVLDLGFKGFHNGLDELREALKKQ